MLQKAKTKVFGRAFYKKLADSKGRAFGRHPQMAERPMLQAHLGGLGGFCKRKSPQGLPFLHPLCGGGLPMGEVARRAGGVLARLLPSITTGKLLNFEFIWTDIPLPAGAFQVKSQNPSVSANAEPAPLAGEPLAKRSVLRCFMRSAAERQGLSSIEEVASRSDDGEVIPPPAPPRRSHPHSRAPQRWTPHLRGRHLGR